MMLLAEVVIELEIAVVAVANRGIGAKKVTGFQAEARLSYASRPKRVNQIRGDRALSDTVVTQQSASSGDVFGGRFRRQS